MVGCWVVDLVLFVVGFGWDDVGWVVGGVVGDGG